MRPGHQAGAEGRGQRGTTAAWPASFARGTWGLRKEASDKRGRDATGSVSWPRGHWRKEPWRLPSVVLRNGHFVSHLTWSKLPQSPGFLGQSPGSLLLGNLPCLQLIAFLSMEWEEPVGKQSETTSSHWQEIRTAFEPCTHRHIRMHFAYRGW